MATVSPARSSGKRKGALNLLLRAALWCALKGWAVLPLHRPIGTVCSCGLKNCRSIGKHPLLPDGVKGASVDASVIEAWWDKWPNANVGIATGRRSGIAVLDVDGEEGSASLRKLTGDELPNTLTALTGRKSRAGERAGMHLYFRIPKNAVVRNSVGKLGHGLDVRGDGGFVVAPPSAHVSGLHYMWRALGKIAPAPNWLLEEHDGPVDSGPPHPVGAKIPTGCRNVTLFRFGKKLRRSGQERSEVLSRLLRKNERSCQPPLDEAEVQKIASNVMRYEKVRRHPLILAAQKVRDENHQNVYSKLLSLARHLQRAQPERPILLPVENVARILGCHWTYVQKLRARAVKDGELEVVEKYTPHRSATSFRVRLPNCQESH